jgi:Insertion element 4 transposase N-terminal
MARPGQQVVARDRLADRIGIGVLAKVFPPELVDRVVEQAGVREQRKRTLPARVMVYHLLAMVLFFRSGYGEVWNKLVGGLDWARRFRARMLGDPRPDQRRGRRRGAGPPAGLLHRRRGRDPQAHQRPGLLSPCQP